MSKNSFEVYVEYLAIKLHFSSKSYDYFKYQGRVKADPVMFETKKERFLFEKIKRKLDGKDALITGFFVANLHETPKIWIGQLTTPDAMTKFKKWQAYQESLSYNFKQEISNLDIPEDPNELLIPKEGQHPILLQKHYEGAISLETLIALNSVLKFFGYWNKNIDDTIIWPNTYTHITKYRPFLNFNQEKCAEVMQHHFQPSLKKEEIKHDLMDI